MCRNRSTSAFGHSHPLGHSAPNAPRMQLIPQMIRLLLKKKKKDVVLKLRPHLKKNSGNLDSFMRWWDIWSLYLSVFALRPGWGWGAGARGRGLRCCPTNDDHDEGDNYLLFKHIHNSQMPIRICNSSGRWSERKWLKSRPGESLIHNQISRLIVSPEPVLISIGVAHPGEK